jgi:hypothetical protein
MTNDCSVCFDEISKTTGSATMACGHCFHIGCLSRWLNKNETCPYCRHEANEHERIEEDKEQDEDDDNEDDDESVDEEDDGEQWVRASSGHWITIRQRNRSAGILDIPEYDDEAHAFWVFRKTMEMMESGVEITVQKELPPPEVLIPETPYGYWDHFTDPHNGYETD